MCIRDRPLTVREAMGAAGVRAAEAIGYKGAGTVEFIVDGSDGLREDGFWFMEMNTRLQVEHPVSELITGVDLVEWQLRVAAGEALPKAQEDLSITGHAFEARLYAEDVPAGFLPATGRLSHLSFPEDVRADSGVRSGDDISPNYDPMIAKVIVHGPTRAVALKQLARGLEKTQVAGTVTNLAFLGALARHEGFGRGEVDTGLIARDIDELVKAPEITPRIIARAALTASGLDRTQAALTGFHLWGPMVRSVCLRRAGEDLLCKVMSDGADRVRLQIGDDTVTAERRAGRWILDGLLGAETHRDGHVVTVFEHSGVAFDIIDPLAIETQGAGGSGMTLAPMPGRVVSVHVEAGQTVAEGDRLAVLEAMKMEHSLTAARDGVVAEILVRAGDQVEAGAPLIQLEDEE
jgi:3-methylcrotonyl-CoA carboxylase alpha subunit